jgi:hypothetical protein
VCTYIVFLTFIFNIVGLPLLLLAESEMQTDCKPAKTMDHAMVTIINNITKMGVTNLNISVTSITSECHTVRIFDNLFKCQFSFSTNVMRAAMFNIMCV